MPPAVDREFQLGADAIIRRHQQRIGEPGGFQIEKASKSAQFCIGARASRAFCQRPDRPDQRIAGGDRNARLFICISRHQTPLNITGLDFHGQPVKRPR
jgi:hypothetical protein